MYKQSIQIIFILMSIFDLYSAEQIDTLISKMGTLERTNVTNRQNSKSRDQSPYKQIDQDSLIQDILAMGTQILKQKEDSLVEIEGLQSREEDSFMIPESFEDIPKTPKNKSNRTFFETDHKLTDSAIKHQTLHYKSFSRSIQKSNKLLQGLIGEQQKNMTKVNKGVKIGNRLFDDLEVRKQKLKQECIKKRINDQYKVIKESKNTTVQLKVPFKKALERKGQELTIGHRLFDNAEAIRVKKQQALFIKHQKQKEELRKLTFRPDLSKSKSSSKITITKSFNLRLEEKKQKLISNKAEVVIDQLKKSPFKPRFLNKKQGVSKISGMWKSNKDLGVSRKVSNDQLGKSFFSQYNKSFVKPVEKSSYIEIKNPQELNFLLE